MDKKYIVFEEFFTRMFLTIRRMTAYYNLTYEEIKQECAIVFFENDEVFEAINSGDHVKAFSVFSRGLRNSLTDFSDTGKQLRGRETKDRQTNAVNRMLNVYEEEDDFEVQIMRSLEMDRLKRIYGEEDIDDVLEYYNLGYERYAERYGITGSAARTKIYRKIKKMSNTYA